MVEERIKRKDLWQGMENIIPSDWCRAGQRLGLVVSITGGKGSHAVIRDPKYSDISDIRGLITTIKKDLYKQMNRIISSNF